MPIVLTDNQQTRVGEKFKIELFQSADLLKNQWG